MTEQLSHALRLFVLTVTLADAPMSGLSTKELAARLNVSVRTIQRDLLLLEEIHIPIWYVGSAYRLTRFPGWLDRAIERNKANGLG